MMGKMDRTDRAFERAPKSYSAYYRQLNGLQGGELNRVLALPEASTALRAAVDAQHRGDWRAGTKHTTELETLVATHSPTLARDLGRRKLYEVLVLAVSSHVQIERAVSPAQARANVEELAADSPVRVMGRPDLRSLRTELGQKAPRGPAPAPDDERLTDREFFLGKLDEAFAEFWQEHNTVPNQPWVAQSFGLSDRALRDLLDHHGIDWHRYVRWWLQKRKQAT